MPGDATLGFLGLCARYGTEIYVSYYNMRVRLGDWAADSRVGDTLGRITDGVGRVTITVDGERGVTNSMVGVPDGGVDARGYFRVRVGARVYVMDRRAKFEGLSYLLGVYYKQEITI